MSDTAHATLVFRTTTCLGTTTLQYTHRVFRGRPDQHLLLDFLSIILYGKLAEQLSSVSFLCFYIVRSKKCWVGLPASDYAPLFQSQTLSRINTVTIALYEKSLSYHSSQHVQSGKEGGSPVSQFLTHKE